MSPEKSKLQTLLKVTLLHKHFSCFLNCTEWYQIVQSITYWDNYILTKIKLHHYFVGGFFAVNYWWKAVHRRCLWKTWIRLCISNVHQIKEQQLLKIYSFFAALNENSVKLTFTCGKSTTDVSDVVLLILLLTLNIFHTFS